MKESGMNRVFFALVAFGLLGCAEPTGDVRVLLDAEATITEGLDPGERLEDIADGWTVRFSRYIVSIGDIHLARSADGREAHDEGAHVVDLATLPPGGITIAELEGLGALRWDRFEYAVRHPEGAQRDESVSPADFDAMVANEWTYLIEGTIERADGQSCPVGGECRPAPRLTFRFGASVETLFGPCEAEDGLAGVTVTESGAVASITIHGDHMFFDAFPSGAEVIERRAQWLANADSDGDDVITRDELAALDASDLFTSDLYNLSGSPFPIESAWDYVRGQLATQGHFQGEGECPWSVDGVHGGHEH